MKFESAVQLNGEQGASLPVNAQLLYGWDINEGTRKQLTVFCAENTDAPCRRKGLTTGNRHDRYAIALSTPRPTRIPSEVFSNHAS